MEIVVGVAIIVIAAIILAAGGWFFREKLGWFRNKPEAKPGINESSNSTAIGGAAKNSAVAAGEKSAAAAGKGVAIGPGQQAPIVIVQPGAQVSVNTNTTVRREELQSEGPAVGDAYTEGVHLQAEDRHEKAIRAFERAFAATHDERNRAALHILISTSLLKLGRLPQAEGHLGEALDAVEDKSRKPKRLGES
jgi:tetratricopeptide (TPR) repeat protein